MRDYDAESQGISRRFAPERILPLSLQQDIHALACRAWRERRKAMGSEYSERNRARARAWYAAHGRTDAQRARQAAAARERRRARRSPRVPVESPREAAERMLRAGMRARAIAPLVGLSWRTVYRVREALLTRCPRSLAA